MLNFQNSHLSDTTPVSFENLLINKKILTRDQIEVLRREQTMNASSQIILLARSKIVDDYFLKNLLINTYQIAAFTPEKFNKANITDFVEKIAPLYFKENLCIPFYYDKVTSTIYIASVDVLNIKVHAYIQYAYNAHHHKIFAATPAEIFDILEFFLPGLDPIDHLLINSTPTKDSFYQNLADLIIQDAASLNVSDIHFDVNCLFLVIRYRIDGVLSERLNLHNEFWPRIINCFKVKSNLNITETRLPQSGRFNTNFKSQTIDCRFSTHPTPYGECAVIRLLNHDRGLIALDQLGFTRDQINLLIEQGSKPNGLIIFTGPTGSGKTTSLYALIKAVANMQKSYITLEDPIEYNINNLRQSQINLANGFDYKSGIKSILRQDPDVILIGEIRDESTALMAIRAAMTGHLVLTTLHVNDVFQVGQRLKDLGVKLSQLSGLIRCLISQRLLRTICTNCQNLCRETFCSVCRGSRHKGRTIIAEILEFDDEINHQFIHNNLTALKKIAQTKKFRSLKECADLKLNENLVTVHEIKRVLG